MWLDRLRQFLTQTMQRFAAWLQQAGERLPWLPAWWHERLPVLEGLGEGEMSFICDPTQGHWRADVSYQYRSLDCRLQISPMAPPPALQRVYQALQGSPHH